MWKTKVLIKSTIIVIFVFMILSGCTPEKPAEEILPQGEQTSGPIPVQIEPTTAPTGMPEIIPPPSETPISPGIENPTTIPPDTPTDTPTPTLGITEEDQTVDIQLDWDIYSIELGEKEKIGVQVVTSSGQAVPFSIQTDGNCVTAAFDMDSITITAGNELCEQVITVTAASAEDKNLKVIVFDPMVLDIGDGLLIRYVNEYDLIWHNSGAWTPSYWAMNHAAIFLRPITNINDGWYPLGSLFLGEAWDGTIFQADRKAYPSIIVKDSKNAGLLAAPLDYVFLDTTIGSGTKGTDAWVWKAVCPEEYVAFGVIATNSSAKPSFDAMRCVKKEYTRPAIKGDWKWDTGGDNNIADSVNIDWGFFSIESPKYPSPEVPPGYALLKTGTSLFCRPKFGSWSTWYCDQDPARKQDTLSGETANVLVVPLPVYKHATNNRQPQLTGREPFDSNSPRFFSAVRVPFTMIPSQYSLDKNLVENPVTTKTNIERFPFYYILREEKYFTYDNGIIDNMGSSVQKHSISVITGFEEEYSNSFSHSVGITVEVGGEVGFLGSGGNFSVSMSYQYSWEETHSYTSSVYTTVTDEFECNPGKYCQYLQVKNYFRIARMDGSNLEPYVEPFEIYTNITKIIEYPPPD